MSFPFESVHIPDWQSMHDCSELPPQLVYFSLTLQLHLCPPPPPLPHSATFLQLIKGNCNPPRWHTVNFHIPWPSPNKIWCAFKSVKKQFLGHFKFCLHYQPKIIAASIKQMNRGLLSLDKN